MGAHSEEALQPGDLLAGIVDAVYHADHGPLISGVSRHLIYAHRLTTGREPDNFCVIFLVESMQSFNGEPALSDAGESGNCNQPIIIVEEMVQQKSKFCVTAEKT